MRLSLTAFVFLIFTQFGLGQKIYNEVIVKLKAGVNIIHPAAFQGSRTLVQQRSLCDPLGYHLLIFQYELHENDLKDIESMDGVEMAGFNEYLSKRTSPNDSLFTRQWNMTFSKLDKVWESTTGGTTKNGKEIVVAVLDDGVDIDHPDLRPNIWINKNEIPNDNKDNDNNGYVDDYYGYNVNTNNGTIRSEDHGTSVSGIIGAVGNNGSGVSGVNWKVKILPIFGVDKLDEIITSLYYVHKMRQTYHETNGQKGAFIPVTNYSGGIPSAFGSNPPYNAWCEMYDLLGTQGVLSIGATDNNNINVEFAGDMPSTCVSDFFICATNINKTGNKVVRAGYSNKFIALGAPGESITTLKSDGGYELSFSGTSAAAPMVAGTVALLYAVGCSALDTFIDNDRIGAALAVKNAIVKSVTTTSSLKSQTIYGGYLNAENALAYMYDPCNGEGINNPQQGNISITKVEDKGPSFIIYYTTPDENTYQCRVNSPNGQIIKEFEIIPQTSGVKYFVLDKDEKLKGIYIVSIIGSGKITSRKLFFE